MESFPKRSWKRQVAPALLALAASSVCIVVVLAEFAASSGELPSAVMALRPSAASGALASGQAPKKPARS